MRGQVLYEKGVGGKQEPINGEVLMEDPNVVYVVTETASHYIPWARVIHIVEAHPTNEEDTQ
ncbi:hypothetical protein [Williamsia sp. D3]|uniref:hypothetical protein n=1 Tax=Williamsia sp. D3 TaxID=1313067 RepID=UPI0003D3170D|nr:hypothetical protein [Williamsia sp. D3]ETD31514.1 hypothetical protein W823_19150 [Williamsia sp. D3]